MNDFGRLEEYQKKLNEVSNSFNEFMKKKEIQLEDLKLIIEKCNIFEKYNIEYLKILKKKVNFEDFKKELKKYHDSISEKKMTENFPNIIEKKNATDRINMLIYDTLNLYYFKNLELENKIKELLDRIENEHKNKFKINFQLLPLDNVELFLNEIYWLLCENLYEKINEFQNIDIDEYDNEQNKTYGIKKLKEIMEMIEESKLYKNIDPTKFEELNDKIKLQIEKLKYFEIAHNNRFKLYLKNMKQFFQDVVNNFNDKFKYNTFKSIEDIKLYEKFALFIGGYDFDKFEIKYINIWNESFKGLSLDQIKKKLNILNQFYEKSKIFEIKNNNLEMKMIFFDKTFIIENFEKYSFNSLINLLTEKKDDCPISEFELLNSVKIQYYDSFIYNKILNDKWKNFFYNVFESPTISNLISTVYKYGANFKDELKKIIDSVKFFNFNTNFLGETFSIYNVYISGLMKRKDKNSKEEIRYYTVLLITFLHEILGHVLVILQRNLYDKTIRTPETENNSFSKGAKKRG